MIEIVDSWCGLWGLDPIGTPTRTTEAVLQKVRGADGVALLKCIDPNRNSDERKAASVMHWFNGDGCVRLLRGDEDVQLMEWIDGPPLSTLVRDGRDCEAAEVLANVVRRLHAPRPFPPPPLLRLDERMSPLIAKRSTGSQLQVIAADLACSLLATTQNSTVLHGDIHHDNILLHPHHGWIAIDPKGLLGDRHYEVANALCNPSRYPSVSRNPNRLVQQAQLISHLLSLELDRVLCFAQCHASLAEIWCEQDGDDPTHWSHMVRIIAEVRTNH